MSLFISISSAKHKTPRLNNIAVEFFLFSDAFGSVIELLARDAAVPDPSEAPFCIPCGAYGILGSLTIISSTASAHRFPDNKSPSLE